MVNTILDIQPWVTSKAAGAKSSDEIIQDLVKSFEETCPALLEINGEGVKKDLFKLHNGLMHCLSTVLCQEIEWFNKLLRKIKSSLRNLDNAI